MPFSGGARACLGKTFSEANLKIMSTILTQNFNFEHVNEKYRSEFPYAHFFQSAAHPVMVKLTLNE